MTQKQINDVIRESRKRAGLTQEQLAEKLGVSNKTVSKWETGRSYPDLLLVPAISKELGISVTEFFDCDEAKPENTKQLNTEKIIKSKTNMIIAVTLILLIAFLILPLSAAASASSAPLLLLIFVVIGVLMIIVSIISAVKETITVSSIPCIVKGDEKAMFSFKNALAVYIFLWYIISFVPIILFPKRLSTPTVITTVYVVFSLILIALPIKYHFKVLTIKNLIMLVASLATLAFSIYVFIYNEASGIWYIHYRPIIIAQLINFVAVLTCRTLKISDE